MLSAARLRAVIRGCRVTVGFLATLVLALGVVGTASAAGGASVGTAPLVTAGVHQFGNTTGYTGDSSGCFCTLYYEYWKVHLIAGDVLAVKFENASNTMSPGVTGLDLYPVGTDDFNITNTSTAVETIMNSNGHAELTYTAPSTGDYPLRYYSKDSFSQPGAYDFWAYVKHGVRLDFHVAALAHSGTVAIEARYPDGAVIPSGLGVTAYGYWSGRWHKIGSAAVRNGQIALHYRIPKTVGGKMKLSVNAGGSAFIGVHAVRAVVVGR